MAQAPSLQQLNLFGKPQPSANASVHIKVIPGESFQVEFQLMALRPHGTSDLTAEERAAIKAAGVPEPAAASAACLLSFSTRHVPISSGCPDELPVECIDIFNLCARPEQWLAKRLTGAREVKLQHAEGYKRLVHHYNQAEMRSSKSEGPIQQGDLLFSVVLETGTEVRFMATCADWRLPAPWLKPALASGTSASKRQLQGEGATMRVSGRDECKMSIDLRGLPHGLREEVVKCAGHL